MTHFASANVSSTAHAPMPVRLHPPDPRDRTIHDPVTFARLAEYFKIDAYLGKHTFALLEIDFAELRTYAERQRAAEAVQSCVNRTWMREIHLGWLSARRLGLLFPNASTEECLAYVQQLSDGSGVAAARIRVYGCELPRPLGGAGNGRRIECVFSRLSKSEPWWKRPMDVLVSAVALSLFFPLGLLIALAIWCTSPGPVFFRQSRVGRHGRPFQIFKFRTMHRDAEAMKEQLLHRNEQSGMAFKISDDPRLTGVGKWLRRTSLDEVPQLINVLCGEMSLVGPRPLPLSDWTPTEGWHTMRHDVRPGITCFWQVSGRLEIPFEEWMRMDLDYVLQMSFLTDVWMLLCTIPAVLTRRGAV